MKKSPYKLLHHYDTPDLWFKYTGKSKKDILMSGMTCTEWVAKKIVDLVGIDLSKGKAGVVLLQEYCILRGTYGQYMRDISTLTNRRLAAKADVRRQKSKAFDKRALLETLFTPSDYAKYQPYIQTANSGISVHLGTSHIHFSVTIWLDTKVKDLCTVFFHDERATIDELREIIQVCRIEMPTVEYGRAMYREKVGSVAVRSIKIKQAIKLIRKCIELQVSGF